MQAAELWPGPTPQCNSHEPLQGALAPPQVPAQRDHSFVVQRIFHQGEALERSVVVEQGAEVFTSLALDVTLAQSTWKTQGGG